MMTCQKQIDIMSMNLRISIFEFLIDFGLGIEVFVNIFFYHKFT